MVTGMDGAEWRRSPVVRTQFEKEIIMRKVATVLAVALLFATTAQASTVNISATGTVIFNGIPTAPLSGVNGGELATVSFEVDTAGFVDGVPGDTRGYIIDPGSFSLSFSGGVSVGLLNAAPTAYFGIVDGFPVSDGFFVSTSTVSPGGVPLSQSDYNFNLDLGYVETTLSSLDIEDAKGVYMFDGLTRFGMTIWRVFPDNSVMEMDFVSLTIMNEPVSVDTSRWSRVKAMYR